MIVGVGSLNSCFTVRSFFVHYKHLCFESVNRPFEQPSFLLDASTANFSFFFFRFCRKCSKICVYRIHASGASNEMFKTLLSCPERINACSLFRSPLWPTVSDLKSASQSPSPVSCRSKSTFRASVSFFPQIILPIFIFCAGITSRS